MGEVGCDHRVWEAPEPTCLAAFSYGRSASSACSPSQESLPQLQLLSVLLQRAAGPGGAPFISCVLGTWRRPLDRTILQSGYERADIVRSTCIWGGACLRTFAKLPASQVPGAHGSYSSLVLRSYLPGAIMLNEKKTKLSAQWSGAYLTESFEV